MDNGELAGGLFAAGFMLVFFVVSIGLYAFFAYTLQLTAKKLGMENTWMAWVPVANLYLMVLMSEKPMWWLVMFFLPFANLIAFIVIWMAIAEKRGKPNWWGLLMLVPLVQFYAAYYLATSE
jgi:hypothetical protein